MGSYKSSWTPIISDRPDLDIRRSPTWIIVIQRMGIDRLWHTTRMLPDGRTFIASAASKRESWQLTQRMANA